MSDPLIAIVMTTLLCGPACDDGGGEGNEVDTSIDTGTGTGDPTPEAEWDIATVEEGSVGYQVRAAAIPGGGLGLVYFANDAWGDGICDEIQVNPPERLRQDLYYAQRSADDAPFTAELVESPIVPLAPAGADLKHAADGRALVAFTGGVPDIQYCGANDAVLARRRGADDWSYETAASMSGDSATGFPESDSGFVVGLWPALALDPDGNPAILHKDAHFGSQQHDDKYRADAELAYSGGGGWSHEAVDRGEGAGDFGTLLFDEAGNIVAVYAITVSAQEASRKGVWAARRDLRGADEWKRVRLHSGVIHQETAAVVDPRTGDLAVAFYSAADRAVKIRRLADHARFDDTAAWTTDLVGDARYDEGQSVAAAFTSDGRLALAYHRCRRNTSTSGGCDINDEAVVLALEDDDGWDYDVVKEADVGSCGEFVALAVDSEDTAHVAFRCTIENDDGFTFRLFVASKPLGDDR